MENKTENSEFYHFLNYANSFKENDKKIDLEELKKLETLSHQVKNSNDAQNLNDFLINLVKENGTKQAKKYYKLEPVLLIENLNNLDTLDNKEIKDYLTGKKLLQIDELKQLPLLSRKKILELANQSIEYHNQLSSKSRAGFNDNSQIAEEIKSFIDDYNSDE